MAGREIHADLHLHTTESDGKHSAYRMLRRAKKVGLDYVAITDHNHSTHVEPLWAQERYGLGVIDGFELTTFGEHIGILGIDHKVANKKIESWGLIPQRYYDLVSHKKLEDMLRWSRDQGAAILMFHPGFPWPGSASLQYTYHLFNKGLIDGAESRNDDIEWRLQKIRGGEALHKRIQRGIEGFLLEHHIPAYKNSDAHSFHRVGLQRNATETNYEFRPDRVVTDIRNHVFLNPSQSA